VNAAWPRDGAPGVGTPPAETAQCPDEVCVTCSDTAVAVTIVRLLDDGLAVVDTGDGEEEVSIALVSAGMGDTILVHAGEAIAVVG
jgi:hydrogenase expression/formation protein HypC